MTFLLDAANNLLADRGTIPDNLGVRMRHNHFPFQSLIVEWAGAIQASVLVIVGIVFVIVVCMVAIGRASGNNGMQRATIGSVILVAVTAVLVGSAFAITAWFGSVDTGF